MQITETRKNLEMLLKSYFGFKYHVSCYDKDLVFSIEHLPTKSNVVLDSQHGDQLIAFYYDEIRCYQLVLFKIVNLTTAPCRRTSVRILDIAEIFKTTDTATTVKLLDYAADCPLTVNFSNSSKCSGEHFCVELNLEGLTKEFPRLVERMCDAIVFLGEVVIAGGENE